VAITNVQKNKGTNKGKFLYRPCLK